MMNMGSVLRSAREAKNLTQEELAEMIDASTRTIIAIERNQRNPTYEVLYRLIHTLDISADLIFRPESSPLTMEQDQVIRELLACEGRTQSIAIQTLRSLIRALRQS
jgi:transcriptional regulator with XRE-family HTH domain